MSDQLPSEYRGGTCVYCGCELDPRVYFCPRCAKPHRNPEAMLPASLPAYEDTETRLRTKSGPAWTIFFIYLGVIAIGSMLAVSIWGTDNWEPAFLFIDFALLVTTVIIAARFRRDLRPLLTRTGFLHPAAWLGLLILVPLLFLNYGYHAFLVELFSLEQTDIMEYFSSPWGPVLFICILPAIVEEIAFRGIIQHQFEKAVTPHIAIGVAALVFSAAHFSILSAPYLALVGALLGWMKWKTGSLYPPMIAHFLHNYTVITLF